MRLACIVLSLSLACLSGAIGAPEAGDRALAGTLWLNETDEWVYRPPDPELDPIRSASFALLFFHRDGTLTRLDAVLIEGLHPKRRYISISNGDGFLLYVGTWRATGNGTYAVQYELLTSDKALGPVREPRVETEIRLGAKDMKFRDATFQHAEVVLGPQGLSLSSTYLKYVCPMLRYQERHVAECEATK